MNTNSGNRAVITASAIAFGMTFCVNGIWPATAQAITDQGGGGASVSTGFDVASMVATRKAQMAHDYVANAVERAAYATHERAARQVTCVA